MLIKSVSKMKSQLKKNKLRKLHLPALVLGALIISVFLTVQLTQKQQDTRSRAAGTGGTWSSAQILPGESNTSWYRAIASSGSTVHVARGEGTIYYRRSTNEGASWGSEVAIGTGTLYLEDPLVAEGSDVYIVYVRNTRSLTDWCCARNVGDIFFRVSRDNGVTWEPERQLTTARGIYRVSIAAAESNVYAVWMDFRSQNTWDLYYRRSVNKGASWEPEVKLVAGTTAMGAGRPQIAAVGNSVHVTWMDGRDNKPSCVIEGTYTLPQCTEVYYKRSTDNGATWGGNVRLTNGTAYSGRPEIAAGGGAVVVSYDNAFDTAGLEEFVVRSGDSGTTWSQPIQISFASGDSTHSSLVFSSSSFHLAWFDKRPDASAGIYYRNSSDNGASWGNQELVGTFGGSLAAPLLAGTPNYIHAIWGNTSQQTQYNRRILVSPTSNPVSQPPSIVPTYACLGSCATPTVSKEPTRKPSIQPTNIISSTPTITPSQAPTDTPIIHPSRIPTPIPPGHHNANWWNHLLDFFSRMFRGQHK